VPDCLNVKNNKWQVRPVWHWTLRTAQRFGTDGDEGLTTVKQSTKQKYKTHFKQPNVLYANDSVMKIPNS